MDCSLAQRPPYSVINACGPSVTGSQKGALATLRPDTLIHRSPEVKSEPDGKACLVENRLSNGDQPVGMTGRLTLDAHRFVCCLGHVDGMNQKR